MCQTTQYIENSMFEVPKSSLVKLEPMIPHPDLVKLQLSCNYNFHRVSLQHFLRWTIAMDWEIHSYKEFFLVLFLLLASLRDTLGVLKLLTIMFISSIQSHIEGAHLVDFTDFGAPFILTFSRRGHIEVVSENTSSRTLYFNVIYPPTPSSENLFNNALTSFVRVKSPQESPMSSVPLIDNIFQCTWMNNKGIGPLIWLCLAISQAHTRPWLVLSVQPQAKLSTPTIVEHFNSSKIKLCACVETKPRSLL